MPSDTLNRPLQGLRVVEVSQLIAAPLCGLTLADLGADVVKVESPHGDYTRGWAQEGQESGIFRMLNRGKRSVVADHRTGAGRRLVQELIRRADIVVENHGDLMQRMFHVDYDSVMSSRPSLIWCSVSGLGHGVGRKAIDMTLQASMGITALTGEADGPPLRGAMPVVDLMTGMYAVQAVLVAAMAVRDGGPGRFVDCAMVDAAATLTASPGALSLSGFSTPRRMGSENDLFVPSRVFATSGGEYVHVVAISDGQWRAICSAVGREDWLDTPRFATNRQRLGHRAEIHGGLAEVLATHPAEHWTKEIVKRGGLCERVREIEEAWSDPLMRDRGLLLDLAGGPTPAVALVGDRTPAPAPALGAHTSELEQELGLTRGAAPDA
jgi:formyl-CoA transferase